jgi:hypothetical protein
VGTESADRGVLGPYVTFDGLPPLRRGELALRQLHPYGAVAVGRYVTPGGGRLTIEKVGVHHRITLDHLGCDAQTTAAKEEAFKRLALAAEGQCLLAGCAHRPRYVVNVYRCFLARTDRMPPVPFVRALLAIELGDFGPTDALAARTTAEVGPPRTPPGPSGTRRRKSTARRDR